jgi:anthranilate synthase component 1
LSKRLVLSRLARTDDLLALHRLAPDRYPFLLQSTAISPSLGRYDILFAAPGEVLELEAPGKLRGPHCTAGSTFLHSLDDWWKRERRPSDNSDLPFTGGWFLFLGYELAAEIEPALELGDDPLLPAAVAVRCQAAIVVDHAEGTTQLVIEETARLDPDSVIADLDRCADTESAHPEVRAAKPEVSEDDPQRFLEAVCGAKNYIVDGDTYQANLSRAWHARIDSRLSAIDVYRRLCAENPGPFAALAHWRDRYIISSSPERLLRVRDGVASTRPIAGTRPRSDDMARDKDLSSELIAHPKEAAEHVMLIDLERNDLGKICVPGSVEVDEYMVIESYAHVHHIVSNVTGRMAEDVTPGQAIAAVFPGGTITGCPKVRCMEIINELESGPRGAYTGSLGYLNLDGTLDLNILIRTMVMHNDRVTLRAGAGIVADSDPLAELAETRAKAKGLLRALST